LLQGIPPYQLAYSMKFPGTSVAYALLMSIFGDSITAIHGGLILINLLTAGLILFLGRNILGELGGSAAAAAYCVLSLMPNVLGLAAHATHFVVMFAVAGTLLLSRSLDRQSRTLIFASGSLFGFALLMKQPGLFFVLFGSVYLFSRDWRAQLNARDIFVRNLIFLSSASVLLLPAVSLLAGMAVIGAFETFQKGAHKFRIAILLLFALCLAWPLWSEADFFFGRPLDEANRMVNGTNPFPESIKIGEYLRAQSSPTDTIAMLGSEPQIYFYAQRHSATGFIYTYGLMEPQ